MKLEDLERLKELAGVKLDEGKVKNSIMHDAENMSKEEFEKKHGKKMADEYFESIEEDVEQGEALTEEQFDEAAGKKDACYHKVKSRYKVWPSAYASGALVKCRKVGAKNWGNKSKKD